MYLNLHHTLQKIDPRVMYCYVFLSISDTIYVLDKYDSYMFWQNIMGFQNSVPPEHSVVISHASNPPYRYQNTTKYNQIWT